MPRFGLQFTHLHLAESKQKLDKIRNGARKTNNLFTYGLAGATKGMSAKKKYPKVPASIAKGNVQFFIKRTSILDLLF